MVRTASISLRMWQWRHMLSLHLKLTSRSHSSWTASELMIGLYTVSFALLNDLCTTMLVLSLLWIHIFFWSFKIVSEVEPKEIGNIKDKCGKTNLSKVAQIRGLPWAVDKAYIMRLFPSKKSNNWKESILFHSNFVIEKLF